MENRENGCNHRSECANYLEKCDECSAHYSNEFSEIEEDEEDED